MKQPVHHPDLGVRVERLRFALLLVVVSAGSVDFVGGVFGERLVHRMTSKSRGPAGAGGVLLDCQQRRAAVSVIVGEFCWARSQLKTNRTRLSAQKHLKGGTRLRREIGRVPHN